MHYVVAYVRSVLVKNRRQAVTAAGTQRCKILLQIGSVFTK